jgi:hypothetical protein
MTLEVVELSGQVCIKLTEDFLNRSLLQQGALHSVDDVIGGNISPSWMGQGVRTRVLAEFQELLENWVGSYFRVIEQVATKRHPICDKGTVDRPPALIVELDELPCGFGMLTV